MTFPCCPTSPSSIFHAELEVRFSSVQAALAKAMDLEPSAHLPEEAATALTLPGPRRDHSGTFWQYLPEHLKPHPQLER